MSGFYINFRLPKLERAARDLGFTGSRWKSSLLNDLLFEGHLCVRKGQDLTDPSKTIWYCMGERASIACSIDSRTDDALFCIGIVPGPRAGGPQERRDLFMVPGPWAVHTMGRRPTPPVRLEDHLEMMRGAGWTKADLKGHADSPADETGASTSLSHNPFGSLAALKLAARPRVDPAPKSGPSPAPASEEEPVSTKPAPSDELAAPAARPTQEADSQPDVDGGSPPPAENTTKAGPDPTTMQAPGPAGSDSLLPDTTGSRSLRVVDQGCWHDVATSLLIQVEPSLTEILHDSDPQDARRRLIARLEGEIAALTKRLDDVPGVEVVAEADDRRRSLAALGMQVSAKPPAVVCAARMSQLDRVLEAIGRGLPDQLPPWFFGSQGPQQPTVANKVLSSVDDIEAFERLLDWIDATFAGAPPSSLRGLAPPPAGGDPLECLMNAWKAEEALAAYAEVLSEPCLAVLRLVPGGDRPVLASRLDGWSRALEATALDDLLEELKEAGDRALEHCPDPAPAADLDEDDRLTLKDIRGWSRARRYIVKMSGLAEPRGPRGSRRPTTVQTPILQRFDHPVTDERGKVIAAPLVIPSPTKGAPGVLVAIPLRLTATAPMTGPIDVTVQSNAIAAVPKDLSLPPQARLETAGKRRVLVWTIDSAESRWMESRPGRCHLEEVVMVPITIGAAKELRAGEEHLVLSMSCGSATTQLRFEHLLSEVPSLGTGSGLGDATASDMVRNHALGAQVRHEKLEALVIEGREPFMVVAPRRFGKTTLLQHLSARASSAGHHVVEVLLPRHLDPEQAATMVWRSIRDSLEQRYGMAPKIGRPLPVTLDDEEAWHSVRRFVKDRGHDAVVVLIDEAQALVPRVGGERWGNNFKTLVDRFLGRSVEGLARAQVALFGTVDLSVRVGQNCKDFLLMHGTEQHAFDDESLGRFLRTVSQGQILTSRQARLKLVEWTNNLRTLNAVLDRVRALLQSRGRLFLLQDDALEVVQSMLDPGNTEAQRIWEYARSELSHQDEWDPVDSFPLALAWARRDIDGLEPRQRLLACVEWLDAELFELGATGTVVRSRVEESLRDLKDRGVLKENGGFWRPLLREMLSRNSAFLRHDMGSQHALLRLAVDSVQLPEGIQEQDEGAQAKVHMVAAGSATQAYRVCPLDSEEERRRFARTCAAVRTLRDRRTRAEGDRHLPRVSLAGFRADDPSQGVIVYDWIEGRPLSHHWDGLPLPGRVQVVRHIALAVAALHGRDIIHCDIAPRNILVDSTMTATLIDFGLARHIDTDVQTQLGSDLFKAPEQCRAEPHADKGSDIYALGRLLQGPKAGRDLGEPLRALASNMVAELPEQRPDIAAVLAGLNKVNDLELLLAERETELEDVIIDAPEWLWDDLQQFNRQAAVMKLGLLPWDTTKAMEVAHLLNNLYATIVSRAETREAAKLRDLRLGEELSLAATRRLVSDRGLARELAPWMSKEVRAMGMLRIAWSHPTDRKARLDEARQELRTRPNQDLEAFRMAARHVAARLDALLESKTAVVERFLEPFWEAAAAPTARA